MNSSSVSAWHDVATAAEVIAQAAGTHERLAAADNVAEERAEARDVLLRVTAAGKQLARVLDELADHYGVPAAAEPSAAYIALDQAAAAAEDMGACTTVAAQAIQDQE